MARGLAAYARGEFYLAHEELEPAWMGTADPGERELLAGLIKLAAAFVHASRGNPAGALTNLRGVRVRLAGAAAAGHDGGLDVAALLAAIDDRLALLEASRRAPRRRRRGHRDWSPTRRTTSPDRRAGRGGRRSFWIHPRSHGGCPHDVPRPATAPDDRRA